MKCVPLYIYSRREPCNLDATYPFPSDLCNQIQLGLEDGRKWMKSGDVLGQNGYDWGVAPASDFTENDLEAGNLYFIDLDKGNVLFRLPQYLITRDRVAKVMHLIWGFKYSEQGGVPGYISTGTDGAATWYPLSALSTLKMEFGINNPVLAPLEWLLGLLDSLIDSVLPNVLNIVPWQLYVAAAGYTGIKTKQTFPGKPTLKTVKLETYAYGLGTGYLAYRALKSYKAKQARNETINGLPSGTKRRAVGRHKIHLN